MQSVPLAKQSHDRRRFDCGVAALNNFLKHTAAQQSKRDNSRTYVLPDAKEPQYIMGFYTLTMVTVSLENLPQHLQKRHPHTTAAALISRLAVDKRYQGGGIGAWLLVDALIKLLNASETLGFPLVIVDAKEGVSSFYEKFGFKPFRHEANKLYLSVADIRASFSE